MFQIGQGVERLCNKPDTKSLVHARASRQKARGRARAQRHRAGSFVEVPELTPPRSDGSINAASMRFRVFCCFIVEGNYSLILFQRVWRLAPHDRRKRLEQTLNALCCD